MNAYTLPSKFSRATSEKPVLSIKAMIALREQIPKHGSLGAFEPVVVRQMPLDIINANLSDDFSTNYQMGRLLHRAGFAEAAIHYLETANENNSTDTTVQARLASLYLDLHELMPNRGYAHKALDHAMQIAKVEKTQFAADLLKRSWGIVKNLPSAQNQYPLSHA